MKELRIEARLRNNVLYHAILDKYKTMAEFCRENDFHQTEVGGLLNLKTSPVKRNGKFRKVCIDLADFFKTLPEDLFPLRIYNLPNTKGSIEVSFAELPDGGRELLQLPASDSPFKEALQKELQERIKKALLILTPREEKIIRMYILEGGYTLEEIGDIFGVCKERIRSIIAKGLRKLRFYSAKESLREYI